MSAAKNRALLRVAAFTRRHPFRGMDRLLRLVYHPDFRERDFLETTVPYDRGRLHIRTSAFLEWFIFFNGRYEPEVAEFIKASIGPDAIAIDVGANIGVHAIVLSRARRVIAVEPNPFVAARLRENLTLSEIRNVEIVEAALSDRPGHATLWLPPASSPDQARASLHRWEPDGLMVPVEVRVATLDGIAAGLPRLDLVKIDTEGHDALVLMGGRQTIARHRPVVIFEWHRPTWTASGHRLGEILELLGGLGYEAGVLSRTYLKDRRLGPMSGAGDFAVIAARPTIGPDRGACEVDGHQ